MRQPTEEEVKKLETLRLDAQIASAEHDLYVIDLREKYGIAGDKTALPMKELEDAERAEVVRLEAAGTRLGTQANLEAAKLRKACDVTAGARLMGGQWVDPAGRPL